jgi:hypothetical protein
LPDLNRRLRGADPDPRSIIFRAVERVMRADEGLSRIEGLQWISWTGHTEDSMPFTTAMCPLICLTYIPAPNAEEASNLNRVNFAMRIECATEGTCIDDSIDLWGMVENSLVKSKPSLDGKTVQDYLRSCVMGVNVETGNPTPAGLYSFRIEDVGVYGQRPRDPDGNFSGKMDLMIQSGTLVGRVVKKS